MTAAGGRGDGGKCGRFSRDGYTFDTGPHLLTLPIVYRQLFLATGAPMDDVLDVVPVDPAFHYRFAERGYDVRERILWREIRTPADLARATRAPGGSIYGSSSNGALAAFRRPANRSPVPGVFLVGGSAHPGGGFPLVGLSASIVADLIGEA